MNNSGLNKSHLFPPNPTELIQIFTMAATAVHMEINSFVGKFLYLSSCGYVADLSFSTSNGEVRLKFEASLGSLSYSSDEFFPTRREKPSRIR